MRKPHLSRGRVGKPRISMRQPGCHGLNNLTGSPAFFWKEPVSSIEYSQGEGVSLISEWCEMSTHHYAIT